MRIGMIGAGYVGLVSGTCFSEFGVEVVCVDKDAGRMARLRRGEIPIFEPGLAALVEANQRAGRLRFSEDIRDAVAGAEAVFIAVGTPSRRGDGHADLRYVYGAAEEIARALDGYSVVVTKSTVPVGTGRQVARLIGRLRPDIPFDVASNPEFLREGSAINDFMRPDRVVIGTDSARAREVMRRLYRPLYLIERPILFTGLETAEVIKYAANSFLATKITFINEIADLCEKVGADVHDVARGIGLDGRIGRKFLHPGPGFGGSCFPKDTLALARTAAAAGAPVRLVETVVAVNDARKRGLAARVVEACGGSVAGLTVAILGLTFKPNTDDLRDSPSLVLVPALQRAGAVVRAFDPEGMTEAKKLLADVTCCADAYSTMAGADALVVLTEWNEFRALDLGRVKSLLRRPVIVDLRNVYNPDEMSAAGFDYTSVGRPRRTTKHAAMSVSHSFEPTVLREYDIRGIVGRTLSAADAYAVGRGFGTIVREQGGEAVCTGYDGRLSSPELETAVSEGLRECGLEVWRAGRGPTPMLYYATLTQAAAGGVMITGSHNPPDHNGFKMMLGKGAFYGASIQRLGDIAVVGDYATGPRGAVLDRPVLDAYVARLVQDYRGGRPLKVAWDAGNGAAGEAMARLTRLLPGQHILLNEAIDGRFPAHHPDPTVPDNLVQLQQAVQAERCDLGIAFDGDGDRIGVVDGLGRVLWGDQLLVLLAREVLAERPGAMIIADVKASQVLFDEIAKAGGTPLMWRTGHSLLKSKMAETGAPLAGEMSGHIFFADRYFGFDDALYAAVRLLGVFSRSEQSAAQLRDSLPAVVNTPELRFPCADDRKFVVVDEVRDRLRQAGAKLSDIDGVRVLTTDGWWLLRASNTQDALVARCEAADQAGLDRLKAALIGQLRLAGVAPPAGL